MPDDNDIVIDTYGVDFADVFGSIYQTFGAGGDWSFENIISFLGNLWTIYSVIAFILSALFIYGIIYSYIRVGQLSAEQEEKLREAERMWKELNSGHIENERWQSVQNHIRSENPNDWKLAIIEADVLLERMLEQAGYAGTTIGDKLRSASTRSFATLEDAWQAHRVRNQIAHGGADFVLTQKVARETIVLYERVFREFSFI